MMATSSSSSPSESSPVRPRMPPLQRILPAAAATAFTIGGSTSAFLHPSACRRSSQHSTCCAAGTTRSSPRCVELFASPRWAPLCQAAAPAEMRWSWSRTKHRLHFSRLARRPSHTVQEEVDVVIGSKEAINDAADPSDGSSSWEGQLDKFVTAPISVYIEDTDAYGVMYNGNYLRAYDRALHHSVFVPTTAPSTSSSVDSSNGLHASHDDTWSIVSVEEIKFKSPPPLGGTYCIEGTRRRRRSTSSSGAGSSSSSIDSPNPQASGVQTHEAEEEEEEVWDMIMRSPDGSVVFNTATGVKLSRHSSPNNRNASDSSWLPNPPPMSLPSDASSSSSSLDTFRTYRDEYEPHLDTHVPLRIALNYMERARTNGIGGPDQLRKLQTEHGVLYVVTAVRNVSLVSYEANSLIGISPPPRMVPSSLVDVETTFRVRKRGAVIDCYHTLVWEPVTAPTITPVERNRVRVAQGVVTIMALDAGTRRPTNKLPEWLLARFEA